MISLNEFSKNPNNYRFSQRSEDNLEPVNPVLKRITELVLWYESPVDFSVTCGIRTAAQQKSLYDAGKTKTLVSRHLTGNAIDLMAYLGLSGQKSDSWSPCYYAWIAGGFVRVIKNLQKYDPTWNDRNKVIWGGLWKMADGSNAYLNNMKWKESDGLKRLSDEYRDSIKAKGRVPFMDYVHFEIKEI